MIQPDSSTHRDARVRAATCERGAACESHSAGHALSFMQRRLASATPSKWRDAIVSETSAEGRISLITIDDGLEIVVWHHAQAAALKAGEPVALHAVYHVLAAGQSWMNVSDAAY